MSEIKLGGRLFRKLKNGEKIEQEEYEAISDLLKIQEANLKKDEDLKKDVSDEKVDEKTSEQEAQPQEVKKDETVSVPEVKEDLENADAKLNKESEDELRLTEADILRNKLRISEEKQKELERKLKEVEQLGSAEFGEKSKPIPAGKSTMIGTDRVR